jgi:hypothetical protein
MAQYEHCIDCLLPRGVDCRRYEEKVVQEEEEEEGGSNLTVTVMHHTRVSGR